MMRLMGAVCRQEPISAGWWCKRGYACIVKVEARVSVVVPVFNGERYLGEALESVLVQTRPADEVLVFDNASTDSTISIATSILGSDGVRTSDANYGAVANFARAAREASGEFLVWLGADDRLEPEHIERCLAELVKHPKSAGCLPGVRFIDPDGGHLRDTSDMELASPSPRVRLRSFVRRNRWTEFYCLYRRAAALQVPLNPRDFATDVLFTWWILLRGPLAVVEEPLLVYREYPNKSVEDMAKAQDPNAPQLHWRKVRLWLRLWSMTKDPGVAPRVGAIARNELLRCLIRGPWLLHFREDVMLRWPIMGRRVKRLVRRLQGRGGGSA